MKIASICTLTLLTILQTSKGCTVYITSEETDKWKFFAYNGDDDLQWVAADTLTLDSDGASGHVTCSSDGKGKCKINIYDESDAVYCGDTYSGDCGDYYMFSHSSDTCSFEKVSSSRLLRGKDQ